MNLVVILLNWHHPERTLDCVRAVKGWNALHPYIIVVDNESTPATREILSAALPADSLICSSVNLGYGGGNNLGIARALASGLERILLLNTDAEISQAAVTRLLTSLDADPGISIIGPLIKERVGKLTQHFAGGRDIARYVSTRVPIAAADVQTVMSNHTHEVDYVSGTALLARSSLFREIGLLDEDYFFSGEIADLCKRAKDRGHRVCVDFEADAVHNTGLTSENLRDTAYVYYSLRNRFLYVTKHHQRLYKAGYFGYWTVIGVAGIIRAVLWGKMAKARAIGLALLHAYRGRYGCQNASFASLMPLHEAVPTTRSDAAPMR